MVARHGDAEIISETLEAIDVQLIRGAGAGWRKRDRGGAAALRASLQALADGSSLVMTADVPPGPARVAGAGIITIARMSGRPIVPVALATQAVRVVRYLEPADDQSAVFDTRSRRRRTDPLFRATADAELLEVKTRRARDRAQHRDAQSLRTCGRRHQASNTARCSCGGLGPRAGPRA